MSIALKIKLFFSVYYHRNWLEPLHFFTIFFSSLLSNIDTVRKNFCCSIIFLKRTWREYTSLNIGRDDAIYIQCLIFDRNICTTHVKLYCKHAKSDKSLLYSIAAIGWWWWLTKEYYNVCTGSYMIVWSVFSHINLSFYVTLLLM